MSERLQSTMNAIIYNMKAIVEELETLYKEQFPASETTGMNWTDGNGEELEEVGPTSPWIKDLTDGLVLKGMVVTGQCDTIMKTTEFTRKDGTSGKVCNIRLFDPTGSIVVPLWDKQVDWLNENIKIGDYIRISNAWRVKKNDRTKRLELDVGQYAKFEKVK